MIGPKQFDIKHKVKPRRDLDNPIVNRLFEPKFKYRENHLKEIVESFVDKFRAPLFEFEEKKISPLSKEIIFNPDKHEVKLNNMQGSFLDKFNTSEIKPLKVKKKEIEKEPVQFTQDMINQITYKVFQNIKNYLDKDGRRNENDHKGIKIEIVL